MSSKRLDSTADYARHGYAIGVRCRSCGHTAKLDARAITCQAIKLNQCRDIGAIVSRLKCSKCGQRGGEVGPAFK